jgi:hypothetical protein
MAAVGLDGILTAPAVRSPAIVMATVLAVMLAAAMALTTATDPIVVIRARSCWRRCWWRSARYSPVSCTTRSPRRCAQACRRASATLTWIRFLPLAIAIGLLSKHARRTHRRVDAGCHHRSNLHLVDAPHRGTPQPPPTLSSHCRALLT